MAFHVAIIGGGLGGTALSLELLKLPQVTSTIYEIRAEGYEEGQHISLAPNALRVMKHIDVLDKLTAIGYTYEELHLRDAKGAHIVTFNNGHSQNYGSGAMRIHRRHAQRVLTEEAKARGIEHRYGMNLQSIQEDDKNGKVKMRFASGETVVADLVVGVDGLHSFVRGHLVPDSKVLYANMMGVTGYLQRKDLHPPVNQIYLPSHFIGQNGFIAVMPSDASGDEIGFFNTMEFNQEKSREEWNALFRDKNAIRGILKGCFNTGNGWSQLIESMCETAKDESLCSWPFYISPPLPIWTSDSGKVLIFGDAAHAMIPTGGLGASLAFEDAECLAHALTHAATSGFDPQHWQKTLKVWEAHRRERLALIQNFTNLNRRLRQPGGSWLGQFVKEWFIWLIVKVRGTGGLAEEIYSYDSKVFEELLRVA